MKNHILFVTDRYCDGKPELGESPLYGNIVNSFSRLDSDLTFNAIHFDESLGIYGKHIDEILPIYCNNYKPAVIFCTLLGEYAGNPSPECLKSLRESGVYVVLLWPDTGPGWGVETLKTYQDSINLSISLDNPISSFHSLVDWGNKHLFLWCPQDPHLFKPKAVKNTSYSFVGSTRYPDRNFYLNHLISQIPDFEIFGGQRESDTTPFDYAEKIRDSQICVNFSQSPAQFFQTKSRVWEVLACGGLLLESANPSTASKLSPGVDYVEFFNPQDLVDKIKYYYYNKQEMADIAEHGHKTFLEKYTNEIFWQMVFERINKDLECIN